MFSKVKRIPLFHVLSKKKAFTLMELLVSIVIVGVLGAVMQTTLISNWQAMDERIARANLWDEANMIVDQITAHAHRAQQINVTPGPNSISVNFLDETSVRIATYQMLDTGLMQVTTDGVNFEVLTENLNFTPSDMNTTNGPLLVVLAMQEELSNRFVGFTTSTKIYPRNVNAS